MCLYFLGTVANPIGIPSGGSVDNLRHKVELKQPLAISSMPTSTSAPTATSAPSEGSGDDLRLKVELKRQFQHLASSSTPESATTEASKSAPVLATDIPSTSQASDAISDVKDELVPVFSHFNANTGCLEDIFNSTVDTSATAASDDASNDDSDIEMIGENIPRPFDSTTEGFMKRDGDPISDNMPFNIAVSFE